MDVDVDVLLPLKLSLMTTTFHPKKKKLVSLYLFIMRRGP